MSSQKQVSQSLIAKGYQQNPSLANRMSLIDWDDTHQVGLLEDGLTLVRVLEIKDIACDNLSDTQLIALFNKLTSTISNIIPLEDENPWTVSIYAQDDLHLDGIKNRLKNYVKEELRQDKFTQFYLNMMNEHLDLLCQEEGLFVDPLSNIPFRGRARRIRALVYRRIHDNKKNYARDDLLANLFEVTNHLIETFSDLGLHTRILEGRHVYHWLLEWFNPKPELTEGNAQKLKQLFPYPDDKPFGWSLAQNTFKSTPVSTSSGWQFDGLEHRMMQFAEIDSHPKIGVLSRERDINGKRLALFDKFPPGTVYNITLVYESKRVIEHHLEKIYKYAIGRGMEPKRVRRDVERAHDAMQNNNQLIRCAQVIFYRETSNKPIDEIELELKVALGNTGFKVISNKHNPFPADSYLRHLPGNYNHHFEVKKQFVSRYLFASDIAALLPLYGRSRGDQIHPLNIAFHRGGEAFIYDQYHDAFKSNNSHELFCANTGGGKSVSLTGKILSVIALLGYRVVALEAGGSFDMLSKFLNQFDKKVVSIKFDRNNPIAINPYIDAYRILDDATLKANHKTECDDKQFKQSLDKQIDAITGVNQTASSDEKSIIEDRDILTEMVLIARTQITGGLPEEEAKMTRAKMGLINKNIINTTKRCYQNGKSQVITQDIIDGFYFEAESDVVNRDTYHEFALSMTEFVSGKLADFFNRPAKPIGDFDYLHIDLGFLKEKGMEASLNVVAISILSRILGIAEANQFSDRPTVLVQDEVHILYKCPLIAAFSTLMIKVSRKLALWMILATQNISDLSGLETKKMLSLIETMVFLSTSPNEIADIEEFRELTAEQKKLLLSTKKYPKLYAEGVLLGANFQGLFRNIPPRLVLALAMTEQKEKAERQKLMDEFGISDIEAVEIIAEQLKHYKHEVHFDEIFDD